ncbi:magnesium chelatase [Granulosicoccaceae sp. 1_MG-2023]|nr:magnesium chelatase [Granulosicoccaceae sp. 1_MG-2023]
MRERRRINWRKTLIARGSAELSRAHLRYRPQPCSGSVLHFMVIDCSSSMLRAGRLALAKGLLMQWQKAIYRSRDLLAVVSFDGQGARLIRAPGKALALEEDWLAPLRGQGSSPAGAAVSLSDSVIAQFRQRQARELRCELWFVTDGRFSRPPAAPQQAGSCTIIDVDRTPAGRCQRLARHWRAGYQHALAFVGTQHVYPGSEPKQRLNHAY